MNKTLLFAIIKQTTDDIDIVYISTSKKKRDKIIEKCYETENEETYYYKSQIFLGYEKKLPKIARLKGDDGNE